MALIKCPECGNMVSDKASACPKCGCPIVDSDKIRSNTTNTGYLNNKYAGKIMIYYCPKCGRTYSAKATDDIYHCDSCGSPLSLTKISRDKWQNYSNDAKERIKEQFKADELICLDGSARFSDPVSQIEHEKIARRASACEIVGTLSIFLFPIILGIIGLVLSSGISDSQFATASDRDKAKTGCIFSIIGLVIGIIIIVVWMYIGTDY